MKKNKVYCTNGGGDEQYTPENAVQMVIPFIQHLKDKVIWCPFDKEDSQFVKVLTREGFKVVYSHIEYGQNFFNYEPENWDVILSNPPYKNKRMFVERCESFRKPWCLFLPINIISDSVLNNVFDDMTEMTMLIPNRRTRFYNSKTGKVGNQPTFKACYIGRNFFTKQIQGCELK